MFFRLRFFRLRLQHQLKLRFRFRLRSAIRRSLISFPSASSAADTSTARLLGLFSISMFSMPLVGLRRTS
jgi:hypothetical protein